MDDSAVEVLLVEDDPADAELTLRALRAAGMTNEILVAEDGAEALDFLFCEGVHEGRLVENGPKLVLLDLRLPKIDGIEVLRRIRSDERTRQIPVVVLSSSREHQDIEATYGIGVNSYIKKPVDFTKFQEAVAQIGLYWLLLNEPPERYSPNITATELPRP